MDICLALEVIEHIYGSKAFLSEVHRVIKPGGTFILTTPNICNLRYRIAFMFGHLPSLAAKADMTYLDHRFGHIRDYTFKEIKSLLGACGFQILRFQSDGISFLSKTVLPQFLLPITFGDSIIVMAQPNK